MDALAPAASETAPSGAATVPGRLAGRSMGHLPELDGVRALAIGVVVLVHLYAPLFSGGNSGVDLFFVLSGFLITKLAYEEFTKTHRFSIKAFYHRRVFRILPPLLVLLAVCLVASFTVLSAVGSTLRLEIVFALFSAGNLWPLIRGDEARTALAHTWSLGLEEQFYLIWPFLLATVPIAMGAPRRFLKWVLGVAAASVLIGRIVVIGVLHYPHWGAIPFLDFDGLALGCAIAIFVHSDFSGVSRRIPAWPAVLAAVALVVDLVCARFYVDHDTYFLRPLVMRLLFAYGVLFVVSRPEVRAIRLLRLAPLRLLGRLSYSLYLWHLPIFYWLSSERYPNSPRALLVPLELVLAFGAAALSYRYVELPVLRLGRRLRSAQATPAPAVA
ncbi:MAG: acyltransferase [Ilumatobacteraceae bacterium]